MNKPLLLLTLFFVWIAGVAHSAPATWKRIDTPLALEFPRDHGAHNEYKTEWWYVTGTLKDAKDKRYGYQLTIFRQGIDPTVPTTNTATLYPSHIYAGHFALLDESKKDFRVAQRIRRIGGGIAGADAGELNAWIEDWEIEREKDGRIRLHAEDREKGVGLDFDLTPAKQPVVHGPDGASHKGPEPGNASTYVSWTRLKTEGELRIDGAGLKVEGESWFDHEFGTSQLGAGVVGWDWFALRFDDGRDLMLYRLRDKDGAAIAQSGGTLVAADGSAKWIPWSDIKFESSGQSKSDNATYPAKWRIAIAAEKIDATIIPWAARTEIDARESTGTIYSEGPADIEGNKGVAYVELTGYATTLERVF